MKKRKNTERALITSFISMMLCMAMLAASTFAWFADSVTIGGNNIVAGNLKIDVLLADKNTNEYHSIRNSNSPIFGSGTVAQNENGNTLWEPGKTQVAYLKVKNDNEVSYDENGEREGSNLALKYRIVLRANTQDGIRGAGSKLYEAMQYLVVDGAQAGNLGAASWEEIKGVRGATPVEDMTYGFQEVLEYEKTLGVGEEACFAFVLHMREDAGPEYQRLRGNFDLTVVATQYTKEEDSFSDQYDKDAIYSSIPGVIYITLAGNENNYFIVNDGRSNFFTRGNGSFYVDDNECLAMTGTGYLLMGWGVDDATGDIIPDTVRALSVTSRIEEKGYSIDDIEYVSVAEDGRIVAHVLDVDEWGYQKEILLGQIPVASFANPDKLYDEGNGLYSATRGDINPGTGEGEWGSGEFDGIGHDIPVDGVVESAEYDESTGEWTVKYIEGSAASMEAGKLLLR